MRMSSATDGFSWALLLRAKEGLPLLLLPVCDGRLLVMEEVSDRDERAESGRADREPLGVEGWLVTDGSNCTDRADSALGVIEAGLGGSIRGTNGAPPLAEIRGRPLVGVSMAGSNCTDLDDSSRGVIEDEAAWLAVSKRGTGRGVARGDARMLDVEDRHEVVLL